MIILKKIIYFSLIVLLLSTLFLYQTNAEAYNVKNSINIVNFECKIYGTVKESVTCIPDPLPDATVTAIRTNLLESKICYNTTTDEYGEYELNVEPGNYIVFAHKRGYRQIYPTFWYKVNIVLGKDTNCSFILRERFFFNFYYVNLESIQSKLFN